MGLEESDYDLGEAPAREVTIAELDAAVKEMLDARKDHDQKKSIASEANTKVELSETKMMELLKLAKKSSYKAEGLGTVVMFDKFSVRTPASADDKDLLFNWIEEKYGKEGIDKFRTINFASLNSLYNQVLEEEGISEIPGVGMPSAQTVIQFRSGRSK